MDKKIEVAIGILCDDQGRLLVGRRMFPPQAGKWEMPGGKVETSETVVEALRREFVEEGGIVLDEIAHWTRIEDDQFILHLFKVSSHELFVATIYEEYRFVPADDLLTLDWIESNRGFVEDLHDIIKKDPEVSTMVYQPQNMDELDACLNEITNAYRSRDCYARITCFLHTDALLFPTDVELKKKVDMMVHEGLTIYAPQERPVTLPATIMLEERG